MKVFCRWCCTTSLPASTNISTLPWQRSLSPTRLESPYRPRPSGKSCRPCSIWKLSMTLKSPYLSLWRYGYQFCQTFGHVIFLKGDMFYLYTLFRYIGNFYVLKDKLIKFMVIYLIEHSGCKLILYMKSVWNEYILKVKGKEFVCFIHTE